MTPHIRRTRQQQEGRDHPLCGCVRTCPQQQLEAAVCLWALRSGGPGHKPSLPGAEGGKMAHPHGWSSVSQLTTLHQALGPEGPLLVPSVNPCVRDELQC